ncbi:polyketide synthase dehydratase domain-containing protein, partial [Bradyrhizobium nitroreducens]|uniref:polyketide synthase dehydratase domain-containing protein n=1 Tax=Bradyrhizobium nitroreducens TaxID=709803 RepID=UPI001AEF4069
MIDFLKFVLLEVKDKRLSTADATELMRQFHRGRPAHPAHLHPLVHRNTSDLGEQRYTSRFTGREFFLQDHQVHGQRVLPGVAHLEMARAAVRLAAGDQSGDLQVRLQNVVFARPVVVTDAGLEVHIALALQDDGSVAFEIYTGQADATQMHSQGSAVLFEQTEPRVLDLPALRERAGE